METGKVLEQIESRNRIDTDGATPSAGGSCTVTSKTHRSTVTRVSRAIIARTSWVTEPVNSHSDDGYD